MSSLVEYYALIHNTRLIRRIDPPLDGYLVVKPLSLHLTSRKQALAEK